MRLKKSFYTIILICIWTFMTYFIIIRNSNFSSDVNINIKFNDKLQYLENGIKEEIVKRDKLLLSVSKILKTKETIPETDTVEPNEKNQTINTIKFSGIYVNNNIPVIPVLVLACNRVSVRKTIKDLINYRENPEQFPIIVSQDCGDEATRNEILSFKEQIQYMAHPDLSDIELPPKERKFKGYYKISRHYGWALNATFKYGYEFVIIVEDDLNIAPDFFEYFLGTYPLLQKDKSLWCVSAWNDNGKPDYIDKSKPELLYRSDFFSGLGWLLSKDVWSELSIKWPKAYWDDWIRQPQQRRNRACIRPEIPRSTTFGKIGVSHGEFFDKHLRFMELNKNFVKFSSLNLDYLLKKNYDEQFKQTVYQSPIVTFEELRRGIVATDSPVRIQYNTLNQYKSTAKILGLMDDSKSGVPRTAYFGIVTFYFKKQRVFLAPSTNWNGYEPSR